MKKILRFVQDDAGRKGWRVVMLREAKDLWLAVAQGSSAGAGSLREVPPSAPLPAAFQ